MATKYAKAAGGNWSASATWSATSSAGADSAGAPAATDDVIFDAGANTAVVVDTTTCVAKTVTCQAAANSITFTATKILAVSGNITFYAGMTLTGTGQLTISANATLTMAGITFPGSIFTVASVTITLADALAVTGSIYSQAANLTFAGAYSITCGSFSMGQNRTGYILTLVAGQTLTVSTSLILSSGAASNLDCKSATASSAANLVYNGTVANCKVAGVTFTDVSYSGATVTQLCNWYGGTLTRTDGIYNATQASFPAVADVKSAVEYGGVDDASANRLTGTYAGGGGGRPEIRGGNL